MKENDETQPKELRDTWDIKNIKHDYEYTLLKNLSHHLSKTCMLIAFVACLRFVFELFMVIQNEMNGSYLFKTAFRIFVAFGFAKILSCNYGRKLFKKI